MLKVVPVIAQATADPQEQLLVAAVVMRESAFNPLAVGRRGELGLMQVAPGTAARFCAELASNLLTPRVNVRCGLRLLRHAQVFCNGVVEHALSRYNGARVCRPSRYSDRVLALLPRRIALVN